MLLDIKDLSVKNKEATYIAGVSLGLEKGQTTALVGQSGSGKTLTALAVLGLLPDNFTVKGEIIYNGKDLLKLSEEEKRLVRASEISYTFQNNGALNPTLKIKKQLIEDTLLLSRAEAAELVRQVGLEAEVLDLYPYQLSGGMRQRIMLAIALASKPKVLIADELTSGLDTTIACQILDLLDGLKLKNKLSMILITHDIGIVFRRADRIAVMYAGHIVEQGPAEEVFNNSRHTYTKVLLESAIQASGKK